MCVRAVSFSQREMLSWLTYKEGMYFGGQAHNSVLNI